MDCLEVGSPLHRTRDLGQGWCLGIEYNRLDVGSRASAKNVSKSEIFGSMNAISFLGVAIVGPPDMRFSEFEAGFEELVVGWKWSAGWVSAASLAKMEPLMLIGLPAAAALCGGRAAADDVPSPRRFPGPKPPLLNTMLLNRTPHPNLKFTKY